MPSRTIHARLSTEAIVSAIELYNTKVGGDAPLSTKISVVLDSLMESFRQMGQLTTHNPAQLESILDEYLSKPTQRRSIDISGLGELDFSGPSEDSSEPSTEPATPSAGLSSVLAEASPAKDPRDALRSVIDSAVANVTQPRPELDPDIWAPDPEELPDPGEFEFDVAGQIKTPIDELPESNKHVMAANATSDPVEQQVELLICAIIDALEPLNNVSDDVFSGLRTKMAPHVRRYVEDILIGQVYDEQEEEEESDSKKPLDI